MNFICKKINMILPIQIFVYIDAYKFYRLYPVNVTFINNKIW